MQVKTILNRVQKFKSFVYSSVRWVEGPGGEPIIEAELRPRANSRARCSMCGCAAPGLFKNVCWSSKHTPSDTLESLPPGFRTRYPKTLHDIDEAHDLAAFGSHATAR